ncbi:hypothetical protein GOBAR_AA00971 [Gossypium barbadense]|uniref:Uncharacterized protein n=1 Tax=Gossypium barbadense TaxID=3634 RepID=A0A2P5YVI8_GOSBA|nr:hypothetical protein GOBAR_AA00971 [Gossypium barbadense]
MSRMRDMEALTNLMQKCINVVEPLKASLLKTIKPLGEVLECNSGSNGRVTRRRRMRIDNPCGIICPPNVKEDVYSRVSRRPKYLARQVTARGITDKEWWRVNKNWFEKGKRKGKEAYGGSRMRVGVGKRWPIYEGEVRKREIEDSSDGGVMFSQLVSVQGKGAVKRR